jgi:Domain of unknown function (DUF4388)
MAMIGDLQSFALPDLLRSLGKACRSGQLSVWSNAGVYRIWLSQGSITAAIPPQVEATLKALCLSVMSPSHCPLLQPLHASTLALAEPLGDWIQKQSWLTETERALVFETQLKVGLYSLFELASGQFYFVGDMVPLPYWEMTGLEIAVMEALTQGLNLKAEKEDDLADLPALDHKFLTLASVSKPLQLSLLDRRLLQWFRQPNTIQSLCQVLNVGPLEIQKACKRLLYLRLIETVGSDTPSSFLRVKPQESLLHPSARVPSEASHSLAQQIAAVLNRPVVGKPKMA